MTDRTIGPTQGRGPTANAPTRAFLSPGRGRLVAGYLLATVGTAALVALFHPFRDTLEPITEGFAFLTLVVVTVAVGGLGPGIAASILGFLAFNFFFIPPYDTFRIADPEHVVVLFVFLGLSILISELFADARARAEAAERRERELRLQQDLAYALVDPRPAGESYDPVMRLIVTRFGFEEGTLFISPRADLGGLEEASVIRLDPIENGEIVEERLTLNVGRRNLGLMVLRGHRDPLSASERRVLEAFCNQMALVLERDRLLRLVVEGEDPRRAPAAQ
jgi:two-component system, OmpR family, sensor histidine kinase KdpD